MRKKKTTGISSDYKLLLVDDEQGIIDSLLIILNKNGYNVTGVTDAIEAIEKIRTGHYDLLILDYLMEGIHGDKVVQKIRGFNEELYILLLTGHKDLAPPLDTIKTLEIQGYCEKSDRFDQLLLLIESGIKSISQVQIIKKYRDGLNRILAALPKIYQLQPIGNILEDVLVEIMPFVNSENAFILIDDITDKDSNKSILKGIGEYNVQIEELIQMLSPELMEQIGFSRTAKKVVKLQSGLILPVISEYSKAIGAIYVESYEIEEYGVKLLEIFSGQAASSINNAFLHSMVNMKNEELNKTYDELRIRYLDTIEALRLAVDARDIYTSGHSDRVAYYAVEIGKQFDFSAHELENLRVGGIFHDIGKIGTADDILLKSDKLDDIEYNEIKKHPIKGSYILSAVSMFHEVVPLVKCHHERVDGRGYPEGLKGDEIPFLARILSVADAFDAMMSDRQYRLKLELSEAKSQLISGAGTQFDAEIVDRFITIIDRVWKEYNNKNQDTR